MRRYGVKIIPYVLTAVLGALAAGALGQLKDEVTLVHSLWDGDELSQ